MALSFLIRAEHSDSEGTLEWLIRDKVYTVIAEEELGTHQARMYYKARTRGNT